MSNAKTGLWSAIGAVLGGAAGVYAGRHIARNPVRYGAPRKKITEAMVVGGSTGAVVGAFIGGAIGGEEPRALPPK